MMSSFYHILLQNYLLAHVAGCLQLKFIFLSVCVSVCMSVCLPICMFTRLFICMSVCLCVCISVRLPVCLFICMSVCVFCLVMCASPSHFGVPSFRNGESAEGLKHGAVVDMIRRSTNELRLTVISVSPEEAAHLDASVAKPSQQSPSERDMTEKRALPISIPDSKEHTESSSGEPYTVSGNSLS